MNLEKKELPLEYGCEVETNRGKWYIYSEENASFLFPLWPTGSSKS